MLLKPVPAFALLCGLGLTAHADELAPAPNLPVFALAPAPSSWSGGYVGSEVFGISGSGRGMKGGVGGDTNFGYYHEFGNNLVVGVQGLTGYTPSVFRNSSYSGFNIAATNVMVGYDMGRFMPYMTVGGMLAKPQTIGAVGYTGASDAVNGLFSGSSDLRGAASVGVGFDYVVNDKVKVGFSAAVTHGAPGFYGPEPFP
jgi:hypothetical protein